MEQNFVKHINEFFKKLIKRYGLKIKTELNEEELYIIEYSSDCFIIKIEKYFREFYITLYKINQPEYEINLFNLLDYLKKDNKHIPKSKYFHDEKEIEESYRKQFAYMSSVIYDNYELINDFFCEDRYEINISKFEKYWKNKHPEFYK